MSSGEFDGLRAVVTGAGSGIGLATARELVARGAAVAALDLDPSAATDPIQRFTCDLRDDAAVRRAVAGAADRLGGIDVLVNNAAVGSIGTVADHDDAEWRRVFEVNVFGIARVTRAALPHLERSPAAAIVNTCSAGAWLGVPQRVVYSASKGAVQALTFAMAADYVGRIRVNCVNPGTVDTPWLQWMVDQEDDPVAAREALRRRQATGAFVTPEEVAHAICYLASPRAGSTTGTALAVDGGMRSLRVPDTPRG